MPVQPLNFGLESRPGKYGPEGGARLTNVFIEEAAQDAKAPIITYCRPGLTLFANLNGLGWFRGAQELDGVAYVVNGPKVNKVESNGTVTDVGVFSGTAPVFMARNRKATPQIALASAGQRAILSEDTVTTIADGDLPSAIAVTYIGGYFVWAIADGRYFWSSIDEGTEYDALDFASAEAFSDGLVGIAERTEEIVLPGTQSIEFHALTGSASVFERVPQTTLRLGCLSGPAMKSVNGIICFPATDGTVRMLSGYQPERISTHDVERDMQALADASVMTAQTFSLNGHHYYCLNSPSWTWVCDLLTRKWFRWKTYGEDRWIAEGFVEIGNKKLLGNFEDNKLYLLDQDMGDDDGAYLIWSLISGTVGAYPYPIIADEVYVDLLTGVGKVSVDDHVKDPKVMLRTSDDDGDSWSDEMVQKLGKIGDKRRQVSFLNLGASGEDGFRFELSVSAPVARCLMRAALRFTPLQI